jgi:hypothetical protein
MIGVPLAYAALVPAKGDARPERQSSSVAVLTWVKLERSRSYVRITFAGFVLFHSLIQAYRAATAGALPEPGLESEPWLVAFVVLLVWLPFLIFAGAELFAPRRVVAPSSAPSQQEALERIEPVALLVVLGFTLLHAAQLAWPLLAGQLLADDVRPELIAILSSTRRGVPLQAIAACVGIGAASFYAVRQLQKALPDASPPLARSLVALGVSSYLLGSYAVIRSASGPLLPW